MTQPTPAKWVEVKGKPFSANKMHYGQKVDTADYRKFRDSLLGVLPDIAIPEGKIRIKLMAFFSTKNADLDNVLKPLLDVLQKRYSFNDSKVYRIVAQKETVPKGQERFAFQITPWDSPTD